MKEFTDNQIRELIKCKNDPVYFAKKYLKIITIDSGLASFNPYDFQKKLLNHYHNNQFSICKAPRQSGKSLIEIAFILHYIIFNEDRTVGFFSKTRIISRDMLSRVKEMYRSLPTWMQLEVVTSFLDIFELENGSRIIAGSVNLSSMGIIKPDLTVLDEFAFTEEYDAEQFMDVIFPVILSSKDNKLIISSTPRYAYKLLEVKRNNRFDFMQIPTVFYKLWADANFELSPLKPFEVYWDQIPFRDEVWKREMIRNYGISTWEHQYGGKFLSSSNTTRMFES